MTLRHHRVHFDRGTGKVGCQSACRDRTEAFQQRLYGILALGIPHTPVESVAPTIITDEPIIVTDEPVIVIDEASSEDTSEAAPTGPVSGFQVIATILLPWTTAWHSVTTDHVTASDAIPVTHSNVTQSVTATTLLWDETGTGPVEPGEEVTSAKRPRLHD